MFLNDWTELSDLLWAIRMKSFKTAMFVSSHTNYHQTKFLKINLLFFNRSLKLSRLVGCDSSERLKFSSLLVFSQGSLSQSKVNEAGSWYNARGELDSLIWSAGMLENQQNGHGGAGAWPLVDTGSYSPVLEFSRRKTTGLSGPVQLGLLCRLGIIKSTCS